LDEKALTRYIIEKPAPATAPNVMNNPGILFTAKLANISPNPVINPPAIKTFLAPNRRIKAEFGIAKIDKAAEDIDPTKARVAADPTPSFSSLAWMTP